MSDKEIRKEFFVSHIGRVSVNNYGAVEFETGGAPAVGIEPQRVIWSVHTLQELNREARVAVSEMKKEGVYQR